MILIRSTAPRYAVRHAHLNWEPGRENGRMHGGRPEYSGNRRIRIGPRDVPRLQHRRLAVWAKEHLTCGIAEIARRAAGNYVAIPPVCGVNRDTSLPNSERFPGVFMVADPPRGQRDGFPCARHPL